MEIPIPAVKLKPDMILKILQIMVKHEDDSDIMRSQIVLSYRNKSSRIDEPSEKNILRAVTFPSLRKLGLIEGEGKEIKLTPNARNLLRVYKLRGMPGYKRKLSKLIYVTDKKNGQILHTLGDLKKKNGGIIPKDVFLSELKRKYKLKTEIDERILKDRMKRWFLYLFFVSFVNYANSNIQLNDVQVNACLKENLIKISKKKFVKTLIQEYNYLKNREKGLTYVPIPMLRDAVCKCFEKEGMMNEDFYEYLRSIERETKDYTILFSQPMLREEGGMFINERYFYYVSIYSKKGD